MLHPIHKSKNSEKILQDQTCYSVSQKKNQPFVEMSFNTKEINKTQIELLMVGSIILQR